ncbi:MAG: aminomethyl-transferring glycine dehydrogenase [Verrucomicrobia bacterium]|nr:aminomethyl-transferring glycine dehydrogenase [Verrucomicrobiota bacterium]
MSDASFAPKRTSETQTNARSATSPGQDALAWTDRFIDRHLGPDAAETRQMAEACGFASLDALIDAVVPRQIRLGKPLALPEARSEQGALAELRALAAQNQVWRSFIGLGYHDCITPPVIQRNILENPGWYTQYTPYQAEISQGRLEALLNFQTMICDLTGLEIANASLLDEATAAAEAMTMCHALKGGGDRKAFFVSAACHPQTLDVVQTRAKALGIEVIVGDHATFEFSEKIFGALVQSPTTDGAVCDYGPFIEKVHAHDALAVVAADLLSLMLLKSPGEFGADIAVGSAQRFGVPMGYGGPHAAFFATRDAFKRHMPGRLVGVSKDSNGRPALRLTLQTREQHIRREKATSNICTAQVLLAIMASMYAVYHGPEGLRRIAERVHRMTAVLASGLAKLGHGMGHRRSPIADRQSATDRLSTMGDGLSAEGALCFDTLRISLAPHTSAELVAIAAQHRVNVRVFDDHAVGVSLDEATSREDLETLLAIFNFDRPLPFTLDQLIADTQAEVPAALARQKPFLTHPVFNRHHSETEMLRYIRKLESRDLSLTTSMIPLGSCTMKLNATAEMLPVTWPEFAKLHPFAPREQAQGYATLFRQLESWLAEVTRFAAVSLQPNAGAQGEYAGLLTIRAWHDSRRESHRRVCLIPTSAHGTNPASAVLAGLRVVPVACDEHGNISLADLKAKAEQHRAELATLMVTYPSTHGVFEEAIKDICRVIHEHGGQVYMDGANLNAQVGLCAPGDIGADVCHINLHKTFCIPHGGGGPGMGPICVAKHLAPFLPGHSVVDLKSQISNLKFQAGAVSAAPWGSAGILPIPWMYLRMTGTDGLTAATKHAILNANYIARRLEPYFPVLYKGHGGLVAHECILDLRAFKSVTVEDVAKRLMDYGFHAPTISWPVPGTVMVEPTESEPKAELDRFCDAMIAIHAEITAVESGQIDKTNNPLKNAPHTAEAVTAENWDRPYSRQQAAYPARWLREHKFWPPVGRIDNVFGDRNPVCSCVGMEAHAGA